MKTKLFYLYAEIFRNICVTDFLANILIRKMFCGVLFKAVTRNSRGLLVKYEHTFSPSACILLLLSKLLAIKEQCIII